MSKTIEESKEEFLKELNKTNQLILGAYKNAVERLNKETQELKEQNAELVEMLERAKLEFKQFRDAFGQGSLLINEIEQLILKHNKQ